MEITYRLRFRDLMPTASAYQRLYRSEPAILRLHLILLIVLVSFLGYTLWEMASRYRITSFAFWQQLEFIIPASCFGLIFGIALNINSVYPHMRREVVVSVSPEKIFQRGCYRKLSLPWSSIQAVVLESDGISFYGPTARRRINLFTHASNHFELPYVIHIPYHAFVSVAQRDEFRALALQYWGTAQYLGISEADGQVWPPAPLIGL